MTELEAANILRKGGARNATHFAVRWLSQRPGADIANEEGLVDLDRLAEYLRGETKNESKGLEAVAAMFDKVVPAGARPRALTNAEMQARHRAGNSANDIGKAMDKALAEVDWKRRRRAEGDFLYFLKTYCTGGASEGGLLEIAPPKEMQPIVRDMEQAVGDASIPYHIRIARGHGKTAYTKGAILWTTATGRRRFVVAVAANRDNAENILDDVFGAITTNEAFRRDFPEVALPFVKLEGAYQRARVQNCHGKPTNCKKAAGRIVLPTVTDPRTGEPFASSGAIMDAVGVTSGARGKAKMSMRPDFIILDDLQKDDTAESDGQVSKMVRKIKRTFLGLAGHRKKISAIMTSTPIEADDLSETFARDKGWKTKTYKMMPSMPKCHDPDASIETKRAVRDWWEEYWDVYTREVNEGKVPHIAANKFYKAHRKAMDEGASVLNPHNFDPVTEISGIQHAMNLLFRDGYEAFMSEYQMQPPKNSFAFEISARLVMSRVRRMTSPGFVPPSAVLTIAASDVNPAYAITTAVVAFDVDMTAFVVGYHIRKCRIPEDLNETEFSRQVFDELAAAGREIKAMGWRVDRWGIDAGGRQFKPVTRFAAESEALTGLRAAAMLGRSSFQFNPNVKSRIRRARGETVLCQDMASRARWVAWNADVYKELMHRAWLSEPGAAGGLSLFDGNANHAKFATQIANEKLIEKTKAKAGSDREKWLYKWKTKEPHDYGDAMAMCYALAAQEGLTGDGELANTSKPCVKIGGIKTEPKKPEITADSGERTANEPKTTPKRRVKIGGL